MSVTIRDVAKAAQTSAATVSKVMNGSGSISQATIDRVEQAMRDLGYHPNARARNFARQSTKMVLFLTTLGKNAGFSNPHMFEMMSGMEEALAKKGYLLCVKSIAAEEACGFVEKIFDSKEADGVVLHASIISPAMDELVAAREIPHIVIGIPDFPSHFSWIDIDNRLGGELAARYLLQCGYCSLAFLGGRQEDRISGHRLEGVLSVLNEHDVLIPGGHLRRGASDCDSGYAMTEELLSQKERPDAIICANNYIAYGCVMALKEHGEVIPEDIGVIAFDEYPLSRILKPMLTVVDIDVFDMGYQTGKCILSKIRKPNLTVRYYSTLPSVLERESTRKKMV